MGEGVRLCVQSSAFKTDLGFWINAPEGPHSNSKRTHILNVCLLIYSLVVRIHSEIHVTYRDQLLKPLYYLMFSSK